MAESPLSKVLRLTGGIVRSYVRMENGRPQQVSPYVQRRSPGMAPGQPVPRPVPAAMPSGGQRRVAFGELKVGNTVLAASRKFKVIQVNVQHLTTRNTGTGVNTSGPQSTGSASTVTTGTAATGAAVVKKGGLNTGAVNPQQVLLGGTKIKPGTPTTTSVWADPLTGRRSYVTLPTGFPVTVVG